MLCSISGANSPPARLRKDNKMPYRLLAASELAEFLRALAHSRRTQVLEELRGGERDVASLAKASELAHSSVSPYQMVRLLND